MKLESDDTAINVNIFYMPSWHFSVSSEVTRKRF